MSLPKGFRGVCNVGLEFDLWAAVGERFLDYVREHCPGIAVAIWPGEQRQLDRWLEHRTDRSRILLYAASRARTSPAGYSARMNWCWYRASVATAELDASYVYVDHGDEFRRQHAAAFPGGTTWAVTIASAEWASNHLLRKGGSGDLPRRQVGDLIKIKLP